MVAIANGIHNASFLFEQDVQDRVVEMGLITKEQINKDLKRFEAYAAKHGLSKADTLRKAVEELLKRDK